MSISNSGYRTVNDVQNNWLLTNTLKDSSCAKSISMRAIWPGPASVFSYISRGAPQVTSQGRFPLARLRRQRVLLDVAKQSNGFRLHSTDSDFNSRWHANLDVFFMFQHVTIYRLFYIMRSWTIWFWTSRFLADVEICKKNMSLALTVLMHIGIRTICS